MMRSAAEKKVDITTEDKAKAQTNRTVTKIRGETSPAKRSDAEPDSVYMQMVLDREGPLLRRFNAEIWLVLYRLAKEKPAAASLIFSLPRQRVDELAAMNEADIIGLASSTVIQFTPVSIIANNPSAKRSKYNEIRHALAAMQAMINCHSVFGGR